MNDDELHKEIGKLAKEATHEAYLRAKNSPNGAVIKRGTEIIRIFADDSYEVLKTGLPESIPVKKGTTFKLKK